MKTPIYLIGFVFLLGFMVCFCWLLKLASKQRVGLYVKDVSSCWEVRAVIQSENFYPSNLAVSEKEAIFASDRRLKCVWVWQAQHGLKRRVNNLEQPHSLAIDRKGQLWVIDKKQIKKIQPDGLIETLDPYGFYKIGSKSFFQKEEIESIFKINIPQDIVFNSAQNKLLVLDRVGARVISVNAQDVLSMVIEDMYKLKDSISMASAITITNSGCLYAIDGWGFIVTIEADGKRRKSIPRGKYFDQSVAGGSLAFHPNMGLIILDRERNRILRARQDNFEILFTPEKDSCVKKLAGLAISPFGTLYICDAENGVIAVLQQK